jgi:hypothetical protein
MNMCTFLLLFRVKYVFASRGLTTLFFVLYDSFRIADGLWLWRKMNMVLPSKI